MLAKVISYAPTRRQAAALLADALARTRMHGVRTNRDLLVNVLRHPAFLDGATDTAFFDTHGLAELAAPLADDRALGCRRWPPHWPMPPTTAAPQRCSAQCPAAGATSRRATRLKSYERRGRAETHEVRYRFTRAGLRARRTTTDVTPGVGARPTRWCCADRPAWTARSTSPGTATRSSSTRRWARCSSPRCRASPIRIDALAHGSLLAPMPGVGAPHRRRGRRRRHRRPAADLAGGHEDGAHHHRTGRRCARRTQRRTPASRSRSAPSSPGSTNPERTTHEGDTT